MAIQKITSSALLQTMVNIFGENSKHIFLGLTFLMAVIGSFFAHKLWVTYKERSAQYDFAPLIIEYETMAHDKDPQWSALLEKFESNYSKHANSSLLPYYLGYKAQILLAQDKRDEALVVLDKMIADLPGSPMLALYEMERALIQLDVDDAKLNEIGLETLKKLSQDKDNMYRDSAQYYVGRYYWANNQIADARAIWQQLVDEQRDEKMAPSPWVQQVQDKLELTII